MIFYRNSQQAEKKTPFHITGSGDGEIRGNNLSGEMSSFSASPDINFRNTFIGVAYALNMHAMDKYVDMETACAISDYYISQADSINTAEEFNRMMSAMCRDFDELSHAKAWESYGQPIDSCIDYVYRNLYSRFGVKDIASRLGYDPSYLSSLFRKRTGQPLHAFIKEAKVQEARVLLLYTSQPLTSIASALGFHSLSHFSKPSKAPRASPLFSFVSGDPTVCRTAFTGTVFSVLHLRSLMLADILLDILAHFLIDRIAIDDQHGQ